MWHVRVCVMYFLVVRLMQKDIKLRIRFPVCASYPFYYSTIYQRVYNAVQQKDTYNILYFMRTNNNMIILWGHLKWAMLGTWMGLRKDWWIWYIRCLLLAIFFLFLLIVFIFNRNSFWMACILKLPGATTSAEMCAV